MFQPHVALPKLVNTFWEMVFGVPGSCWQAYPGITKGLDENRHSFVAQRKA
jgi:hypothetical protein